MDKENGTLRSRVASSSQPAALHMALYDGVDGDSVVDTVQTSGLSEMVTSLGILMGLDCE